MAPSHALPFHLPSVLLHRCDLCMRSKSCVWWKILIQMSYQSSPMSLKYAARHCRVSAVVNRRLHHVHTDQALCTPPRACDTENSFSVRPTTIGTGPCSMSTSKSAFSSTWYHYQPGAAHEPQRFLVHATLRTDRLPLAHNRYNQITFTCKRVSTDAVHACPGGCGGKACGQPAAGSSNERVYVYLDVYVMCNTRRPDLHGRVLTTASALCKNLFVQ